jgi:hypothetical protein
MKRPPAIGRQRSGEGLGLTNSVVREHTKPRSLAL